MSILGRLKGLFSNRQKALSQYRSGMDKAKRKDFPGAVADYSEAIRGLAPASDVMAMALYNRALAYSSIGEDEKAAADLTRVLSTPGLSENVKLAASQRRERLRRRDLADGEK